MNLRNSANRNATENVTLQVGDTSEHADESVERNLGLPTILQDQDLQGLGDESRLMVTLIISKLSTFFTEKMEQKDAKIAKLEEITGILKSDLSSLQVKLEKQEERIESLLQESIKDTLVLSGELPTYSASENCTDVIVNSLNQSIEVTIPPEDIVEAYRVGNPKQNGEVDKRPIKFKFKQSNIDYRRAIATACARFRPNIYVNEFLTQYKKDLFAKVKKIRKKYPGLVGKCYVNDGIIVIKKLTPQGKNIRVNSQKDWDNYLHELKIPDINLIGNVD